MRTLGIEIKGSDCVCLLLEGVAPQYQLGDFPKKVSLKNSYNSTEVRDFQNLFKRLIAENSIEKVAIKKRNEKGKFAGGALSFKMEGLIQTATDKEVLFISSPQITSLIKKSEVTQPDILKYQEQAFYTALCAMEN